ncbi:MAG: hypothetical protein NZ955_07600 [Candidatus Bathyarchaeota archaeon]|nr:hypothetical protein [Candidatus Bathyarchaeota archaeon]
MVIDMVGPLGIFSTLKLACYLQIIAYITVSAGNNATKMSQRYLYSTGIPGLS